MAGRKKRPPETSERLSFGPSLPLPDVPLSSSALGSKGALELEAADLGRIEAEAESLDDYEDPPGPVLVDPPRRINVIVEAVRDGFEVSRLRDGGTTVACVFYSKDELRELIGRATTALELSG